MKGIIDMKHIKDMKGITDMIGRIGMMEIKDMIAKDDIIVWTNAFSMSAIDTYMIAILLNSCSPFNQRSNLNKKLWWQLGDSTRWDIPPLAG